MAIDFSKFLSQTKTAQKGSIDFSKFLPKESQSVQTTPKPTQPVVIPSPFNTIHKLQGGGAFFKSETPNTLIKKDRESDTYGGLPTKKGYERADIVPVSLGGVNDAPENITYEKYPLKERAIDTLNKFITKYVPDSVREFTKKAVGLKLKTTVLPPQVKDTADKILSGGYIPQTRTDDYIKKTLLPDYKAGKITLNEARVKAIGFLNDEQEGLKKTASAQYPSALKNTVTGVLRSVIEQYTKPSENILEAEKLLGANKPKNKIEQIATAPLRTAEKLFIRTFGPMVDPLATDIGEIVATNELSNKVSRGEMPPEVLNDIDVLKKTIPQIVGDVSQAVLTAYIPSFAKEAIGVNTAKNVASKFGPAFTGEVAGRAVAPKILERVATGGAVGLKAGTLFGGAQALSSGSKELKEIANIIGQNVIFGVVSGGVASGLAGVLARVKEVKSQLKDPKMKDLWSEVENSVKEQIKNPEIIEKEIDTKLDAQIKLLDAPQQNKMLGTTEPKLLEAPKKRAETQGQGFVMTDKANKEKVALIKTINNYREELKSFIKNPTPTKVQKVQEARLAMDEGLANWDKAQQPKASTPFQLLHEKAQTKTPIETPKVETPKVEPKATTPFGQLHEQMQTKPLTKPSEPSSVKTEPKTVEPQISSPEPIKTQGEGISGQIKPVEAVSGVAKQIEAKAVEKGMIEKGYSHLAGYDASTIKAQSELASKYTIEQIKDIATGKVKLPERMKPGTPLSIAEDYAMKNDPQLLIDLAKSPLATQISESASEVSLSRMRDKESAVAQIKKVSDARQAKAKEQTKAEVKKIKEEIKKSKITKDVWSSFVDEITC